MLSMCSDKSSEILLCVGLLLCVFRLGAAHGVTKGSISLIDAPLLTEKIATNRSIIVDAAGDGEFKSIQSAIDSVPEGNSEWIIVHVRKGVYG